MSSTSVSPGRRERNKQAKLERITQAASELFARHGVDEVTTQQIAEAADVGAGTLFLYARTKGELLLLVQNVNYAHSLESGIRAARDAKDAVEGVLAIATPIVECNRVQVENGRTYLREVAFGDPTEPHRAEALSIVARTEEAMAGVLAALGGRSETEASVLAHVVTAIMFLAMASTADESVGVPEIMERIRVQLEVVLAR